MLDFLFRRGNPTNDWRRSPDLILTATLDEPSLNGVTLGSRFEHLSSLGRNDGSQLGSLCYFDFGVRVAPGKDGTFQGFAIVLTDEDDEFQPYRGTLSWKRNPLDLHHLTRKTLPSVFGDWYWIDTDDNESIALYEFPGYEMQIELALSGAIKAIILTNDPLMADPEQRDAYNVDKPWPPHYGS
tara:strand:+ start:18912 stop:19463 length:552 start_codon:yes stop_codon:yes gene_type:complete